MLVVVERVVEAGDHARGVAEGRVVGHVLHPLAVDVDLAVRRAAIRDTPRPFCGFLSSDPADRLGGAPARPPCRPRCTVVHHVPPGCSRLHVVRLSNRCAISERRGYAAERRLQEAVTSGGAAKQGRERPRHGSMRAIARSAARRRRAPAESWSRISLRVVRWLLARDVERRDRAAPSRPTIGTAIERRPRSSSSSTIEKPCAGRRVMRSISACGSVIVLRRVGPRSAPTSEAPPDLRLRREAELDAPQRGVEGRKPRADGKRRRHDPAGRHARDVDDLRSLQDRGGAGFLERLADPLHQAAARGRSRTASRDSAKPSSRMRGASENCAAVLHRRSRAPRGCAECGGRSRATGRRRPPPPTASSSAGLRRKARKHRRGPSRASP